MTVPVEAILAAKRENPDLTIKKIAAQVGASPGSVQRALQGKIVTPRQMLKNKPKPFKRVPYAGRVGGGGEWNDRGAK